MGLDKLLEPGNTEKNLKNIVPNSKQYTWKYIEKIFELYSNIKSDENYKNNKIIKSIKPKFDKYNKEIKNKSKYTMNKNELKYINQFRTELVSLISILNKSKKINEAQLKGYFRRIDKNYNNLKKNFLKK